MQKSDEQHRRELEARAHARIEELSALSTHLLRDTEHQRSELAKQLHDELGGLITAAKMDMAWLSARIGHALDPESQEKFNSVVQMLNQAMMLKRRVVEDLRPSLLDHFGLAVAMRSHFDENCRRAGIECVASLPEDTMDIDATTQLTLFRVAQEVLANIISRGGARNVEIVIEPHEEGEGAGQGPGAAAAAGYLMTIGDDGNRMETDLSLIMPSVRHRVQLVQGTIDAEVRNGGGEQSAGNRVRVFVPRSAAGSA